MWGDFLPPLYSYIITRLTFWCVIFELRKKSFARAEWHTWLKKFYNTDAMIKNELRTRKTIALFPQFLSLLRFLFFLSFFFFFFSQQTQSLIIQLIIDETQSCGSWLCVPFFDSVQKARNWGAVASQKIGPNEMTSTTKLSQTGRARWIPCDVRNERFSSITGKSLNSTKLARETSRFDREINWRTNFLGSYYGMV